MRREIDRLSRLASDLLLLTQLEAGGRADVTDVDLADLVDGVAEATRVSAPGRRIESLRSGPVPVRADPDWLTRAIRNLIDNALRHAPAEGRIELSSHVVGDQAVVAVVNEGDPIAAEHLPHLFERFYRVSSGRDVEGRTPQAGLGLAIVRAVVTASGGTVTVSSDECSTRFDIRLPLAEPRSGANDPDVRGSTVGLTDGSAPSPTARSAET